MSGFRPDWNRDRLKDVAAINPASLPATTDPIVKLPAHRAGLAGHAPVNACMGRGVNSSIVPFSKKLFE
jgi:hypothetical protein